MKLSAPFVCKEIIELCVWQELCTFSIFFAWQVLAPQLMGRSVSQQDSFCAWQER